MAVALHLLRRARRRLGSCAGRCADRRKDLSEHRKFVHAADWHEREAEDLFGLNFAGHPRLGDFILHDDAWQENVEPMRRHFDPQGSHAPSKTRRRLASAVHR